MANLQRIQFTVQPSPPPRITERAARESEVPPVKRLDGEVMKQSKLPFAGGTNCEVWVGRWKEHSGACGREEAYEEKVGLSLSLTTSTLLTKLFVGGLKSPSDVRATGEGSKGSAIAGHFSMLVHTSLPCC